MGDVNEARALQEMAGQGTIHDQSYSAYCEQRWAKLLKPVDKYDMINHPYVRKCTAVLLENEMTHVKSVKSLQEDTLSTNAGSYTKYVFPILRRVFPNLIANQLVSVQPQTSRVAGVFYFEKKYDDRKGSKIPQYGITNATRDMGYEGELSAADNINQNFARQYSSEFVDYDVLCTDTGAGAEVDLDNTHLLCRLPNWKPIRAPGVESQRTFYVKLYYRVRDAAGTGTKDIIATLDPVGLVNLVDQYGVTVGAFATATGIWSLHAKDEAGNPSIFTAHKVIYAQYFVNWELVGYTSGAAIPSISLDIQLYTMKAEMRPIKAKWTLPAMHDMQNIHGMNTETELVSTFANEVGLETDRDIVDQLVTGAKFAASYTYLHTAGSQGELETIRNLLTMISAVGAEIHRASGRAPANFIVVPTGVGALLDQLSTHGDFASIEQNVQASTYGPITSDFGIARIGTLLKRYAVYQDPYMAYNKVLVGLKGNNFLDAGFVYAPYVPFQLTPTFTDPNTLISAKGMYTMYSTKMLRPEYYGVITCSGLPTVTTV